LRWPAMAAVEMMRDSQASNVGRAIGKILKNVPNHTRSR
jgi:hypothetical protein